MRNNRKWLAFVLCVMMLCSCFSIPVHAAENESPIALKVVPAGAPGHLKVQVEATRTQTVADGKLVFTYDAEKLTYVGAACGDAWADQAQVTLSANPAEGKVILAFASADYASEGALFTLTFKAESYDTVVALDSASYISGVSADLKQELNVCPSAQFVDMQDTNDLIHEAVDYMVGSGCMNGMDATHFGPNLELNRAMMVTILYRIAGSPEVEGTPAFTDVPDGKFYTMPVVWAVENGITNGISATHFAPGKDLTRQELVTFLYRFAKHMDYDVTKTTDLSGYTDADEVQPYAVDAFKWAIASGVVKGTSETTLSPENFTTRAQICIMVQRLLTAQK